MTRSTGFWNLIAKTYAKNPIADEAAYQYKLEQTQALFSPDMRLFEFGCGTGSTALTHAPFVAHIDATDYAHKMIAIARGKAEAAGVSNVTFEQSTLEDWLADAPCYDIVLGMSILHLLPDLDVTLANVRRLTKPGGYFVSSSALSESIGGFTRAVLSVGSALRLLPYLNFPSRDKLTGSLERAGFEIVLTWQPKEKSGVFIIAKAV
ncbi:MAG: class I SAM-dependent methyltransferase [Rhodobacteraceae bacterium]|nr:class I SAM-dependent methyltransferase [Paracoccaceae bacterium]